MTEHDDIRFPKPHKAPGKGVVDKVIELAPTLVKVAVSLIETLVSTLSSQLPAILDVLLKVVLPELISGLGTVFETLVSALPDVLTAILSALPTLLPMLIKGIVDMVVFLCDHFMEIVQPILDYLPDIIMAIVTAVCDNLPILIDGALTLLLGLVEAFPQMATVLTDEIPTIVEMLVTAILECLPQLLVGIGKLLWGIAKALPTLLLNPIKVVYSVLSGVWNSIKKIFSPEKVKAFFSSIWGSIKGAFGKVTDWFKSTFTKAWSAVKNVFSAGGKIFDGIKSGISNVFKTVVNSLIRGINKIIATPFNTINGLLNTVRSTNIMGLQPFLGLWKHNPLAVPAIPQLARGGVLEKGQVGLLEGDGAEAVVPLEKNTEWLKKVAEKLSRFLLDDMSGIQLERSLMSGATSTAPAVALVEGLTAKMDNIIAAIEKGHILALDGDAIVGATAAKMDNALGRRRTLASRGAI